MKMFSSGCHKRASQQDARGPELADICKQLHSVSQSAEGAAHGLMLTADQRRATLLGSWAMIRRLPLMVCAIRRRLPPPKHPGDSGAQEQHKEGQRQRDPVYEAQEGGSLCARRQLCGARPRFAWRGAHHYLEALRVVLFQSLDDVLKPTQQFYSAIYVLSHLPTDSAMQLFGRRSSTPQQPIMQPLLCE